MKIPSSVLFLLGLFGTAAGAEGGTSCACVAEELGFAINCVDSESMLDALAVLNSNSCAVDCSSDECVKNYYIVQAHHDFCPDSEVPDTLVFGFHNFDNICTHCDIKKSFVEGAPNCPVANCEDQSGNSAHVSLMENGCATDCSSDLCRDLFFVLRSVHDNCDHETLTTTSEMGLHALEGPCAQQVCNQSDGAIDQLKCEPPAPFEWAGVFAVADSTHTWSMQAIDGAYADPSMRLVLFSTAQLDVEGIHSTEVAAGPLIEGDSCVKVEDGESMGPIAVSGSCFELHVGATDDSTYTINTDGIDGIVVYAQHVPIEFERDTHYFMDSAGGDVEPIVEEGGGGHGHDHAEHDHESDDHESGVAGSMTTTATGVAAVVGSLLMAV